MPTDILLGAFTLSMAVLGGIVSVHAPARRWQKVAYGGAFVHLGCIAMGLVIKQSKETAVATSGLADSVNHISGYTKEISRMTGLNAQLQQQLLSQSGTIADLSRQSLALTTGGRSYLYFEPQILGDLPTEVDAGAIPKGSLILSAFPKFIGKFPLHNVYVSTFGPMGHLPDLDYQTMFPGELGRPRQFMQFGFKPDRPKQIWHISINTSNGSYYQTIFVEKIDEHWVCASRFGRANEKMSIRLWSSPDFPKDQLNASWD